MEGKLKNKNVVFIDLDGTLIKTRSGEVFPKGVWDMNLNLKVFYMLRKMASASEDGISVVIVSNQGGIEKGYVDYGLFIRKMDYVKAALLDYLGADKRNFVHGMFCTSNDKENKQRKPNIGMFTHAKMLYLQSERRDPERMIMIGDASGLEGQFSDSDKKFAENAGIDYMDVNDFIYFGSGEGE